MKFPLAFVSILSLFMVFSPQTFAEVGEVNYISDVLSVPVRSGPSPGHRVVHRGLQSGTRLTILTTDEEAGFTQIRTDGGTEGWVRSQYLVKTPIAKARLAAAQARLQKLQAEMSKEKKTHADIQAEYKEVQANNQKLNSRAQALEKELEEIKRISANALTQHERIMTLTEQNKRLLDQVDELSETVRRQEENIQREWLLIGGSLVIIGLLLGVWIKARPRKTTTYTPRYN